MGRRKKKERRETPVNVPTCAQSSISTPRPARTATTNAPTAKKAMCRENEVSSSASRAKPIRTQIHQDISCAARLAQHRKEQRVLLFVRNALVLLQVFRTHQRHLGHFERVER